MKIAKVAFESAQRFPYDADDAWWHARGGSVPPPPAADWAHAAARAVVHDLSDRRKIKRGFEHIDEAVRKEIVESIAEIIRYAHGQGASSVASKED